MIPSWQSKAEQQQQNPAETHYQTIKRMTNTLLDQSGSPAYTWLLCLMYVCILLNDNSGVKDVATNLMSSLWGS
jgi:hypothetical protein